MACPSKEHLKRAWIQWPLRHVAVHWFAQWSFPPFRPRFKVRSNSEKIKGPNFIEALTKVPNSIDDDDQQNLEPSRYPFRAGDRHNMFVLATFDVLSSND